MEDYFQKNEIKNKFSSNQRTSRGLKDTRGKLLMKNPGNLLLFVEKFVRNPIVLIEISYTFLESDLPLGRIAA